MKRITTTLMILVLVALLLPVTTTAQEPVECETEYTVQVGDWLSKIADKYYGDMLAYPAIVTATNAQADEAYASITNPDLIEPGWTLCIPGADDAAMLMATSVGGSDIISIVWTWQQTLMNDGTTFVPDDPSQYTLELAPVGSARAQADCNLGNGTYTISGNQISIEILTMTMAMCLPGSLSDEFVANLNAAALYFVEDENLFIDLMFDSGTMKFAKEVPASAEVAPSPDGILEMIQLPDGTQCLHAGRGATLAFDGKRLNYTCGTDGDNEVGLIGDMGLDLDVLTVERALYGRDDSGFVLKASEPVVMTIVEIELVDGTQCLNAGHGATLAFDDKRLNFTCDQKGDNEVGLIGDMDLSGDVLTAEKALIGHDESGFSLIASEMTTAKAVQGGEAP
jgi:heat shock protein HslJ